MAFGCNAIGGAIYSSSGGSVTITSSTLTKNSAMGAVSTSGTSGSGVGGAVCAFGNLTITSSLLSANTAAGHNAGKTDKNAGSGSGGAIFAVQTTHVTNSTVTGNHATGGDSFYGANGGAYGGGIFALGTLSISGTTVSNNSATSGVALSGNTPARGGGIYSDIYGTAGTLSLVQSTLSGNTATGGPDIAAYGAGCPAQGGGLFAHAIPATITQCTFSANAARAGMGSNSVVGTTIQHTGPGGSAQGGGLWIGKTSTILASTFANNLALGGVGGSDTNRAPHSGPYNGGNGGNGSGGAIYAAASINLFDSTLSGNTAAGNTGGAGYPGGGESFRPPSSAGTHGTGSAGGLFLAVAKSILDNTIVSANHAGSAFGDISGVVNTANSHNNLIGTGSGALVNGANGNKVGINAPKLEPLGNYGGSLQTMPPQPGSPAINTGGNAFIDNFHFDQTNQARIANGIVDIGAFETQAPTITLQPVSQIVIVGATVTFTAAVMGNPVPDAQWQVSTDGGTIWSNVGGTTSTPSTSLSFVTTATQNGRKYRVVFTNYLSTVASIAVTLTVEIPS